MRIEARNQTVRATPRFRPEIRPYRELQTGQKAPIFVLPDADMEIFDLLEWRGRKHVVLHFYPRDRSPGGILQASDFSDHDEDFDALDCEVLAISPDDCPTHAEFRDEYGLSLRLLSDEDCEICCRYGAWRSHENGGVVRAGVMRSTFIIDKRGIIRHIFRNVAPRDHVVEVLRTLRQL